MSWSIWEKEMIRPSADVVIVGAGITGLSTAWFLKESHPELDVLIVDRSVEGTGASTRNAGFACMGSLGELVADSREMGMDAVCDLYKKRWEGLQLLTNIIPEEEMGLVWCGGYELFFEGQEEEWENVREALDGWNERIANTTGIRENFSICSHDEWKNWQAPKDLIGAIRHKVEGRLNSGKMVRAWLDRVKSKGVRVQSGVSIEAYSRFGEGVALQDNFGRNWQAGKLLLATNAFTPSLLKGKDIRPARNQIFVSQPLTVPIPDACFHVEEGYIYFRRYGDRLLIGGARNRDHQGESTDQLGRNEKVLDYLIDFASRLTGQLIIPELSWSGIIGVGSEKLPIVEKVDENIFLAARLSGMGVALGSAIGRQTARLIDGEK